MSTTTYHSGRPLAIGPPPEKARATLILVHGRGASAESILTLAPELAGQDVAALAPQARGNTWYPNSFLAPLASNQPFLDSALANLEDIVTDLLGRGVKSEQIVLVGFSQGACLASEFVARNPRRYGGLLAFTGGLIGPPGTPRDDSGSLDGTPVFLGCGDPDPHVPFARVQETHDLLTRMGARVDTRRYPGMGHTINADQIQAGRQIISTVGRGEGCASPLELPPLKIQGET